MSGHILSYDLTVTGCLCLGECGTGGMFGSTCPGAVNQLCVRVKGKLKEGPHIGLN